MAYNLIYNNDPYTDLIHLLTYINDYTKGLGEMSVTVDPDICYRVLMAQRADFPHIGGLEGASVFKKLANFMCYFIGERPLKNKFSAENIPTMIFDIPNHANAMVALQLAIDSLHGAEIIAENSNNRKVLKNRIELSFHSYVDILDAIGGATINRHYKVLAVLLEQLAYKTNPDCQYKPIDI